MRLLFVHADHLEFETTTEAGEGVGETEGVPMAGRMEDCVTAFVSVESDDEADPGAVVENAANELRDAVDRLNARKVVLYPYPHLSDGLAGPESAKTVLQDLETALEDDFELLRAPVGWYKAFEISCKGHPLSEGSRRVTPERRDEGAEDAERAPSEWKLLFPGGEVRDPRNLADAKDADLVSAEMRALVEAEVEEEDGETASKGERPRHVELMREREFADCDDEYNDVRDLRWYPRGKLLRDSLAEYVTDLAVEHGAMPVETSDASDPGMRATREQGERSGGQLSILRDVRLDERDLPLRLYEMPGLRTACADLEQAREELRAQAKLALRIAANLGLDYQPAIRVTREFHDADEAWVRKLVADLDRPALLEILPERRHDWAATVEFATIDRRGSPVESATAKIDVESAERFDIEYGDGEVRHHPPILHCSPSGSIESAVAALLETAAGQDTPRLPTWLSPTQVRFVPVGEEHVEYCDALVEDLEAVGIRADVDDRDETVGRRIARADADWVPYYAVVGDRELESDDDALGVNVRAEEVERELTLAELRETFLDDVGDLPKIRRYLPKRVSRHPHFTGE